MARTRRRKPGHFYRKDSWTGDPEVEARHKQFELRWVRGFYSSGVATGIGRDGQLSWKDCEKPRLKRWYKKLVRRGRRRIDKRILREEQANMGGPVA